MDGEKRWRWVKVAAVVLLAGCEQERVQSALHPAGPAARAIADLWWFMFWIFTAAFVVVFLVTAWAVLRPRQQTTSRNASRWGHWWIVGGGIVLPTVVVSALLIYSLTVTMDLRMPDSRETIRVIGHRWWWEVQYPDHGIVTANELHIPVGEPVRLELVAADIVHSFWVPELHGKMDLLPDHVNHFWIQADAAGVYRGQCAEYCGVQHARMAFYVMAMERREFEQWMATRQAAARGVEREPGTPAQQRGREVFFEAGCNACHAIRDEPATAQAGPDLTHFGSRLSIGAGQWPNTQGHLAGWLSNPQTMKPGNLMPRTYLASEDLHALVSYLQSLE